MLEAPGRAAAAAYDGTCAVRRPAAAAAALLLDEAEPQVNSEFANARRRDSNDECALSCPAPEVEVGKVAPNVDDGTSEVEVAEGREKCAQGFGGFTLLLLFAKTRVLTATPGAVARVAAIVEAVICCAAVPDAGAPYSDETRRALDKGATAAGAPEKEEEE